MAEVTLHPAAEEDYRAALEWYRERSVRAAIRFESAFELALEKIAANPELFPLCDDRHRFHKLKRYPYLIIYRVSGDELIVIAVAHGRRSRDYWQRRNGR